MEEWKVFDARTDKVLLEGTKEDCMLYLNKFDEKDESFEHLWMQKTN